MTTTQQIPNSTRAIVQCQGSFLNGKEVIVLRRDNVNGYAINAPNVKGTYSFTPDQLIPISSLQSADIC